MALGFEIPPMLLARETRSSNVRRLLHLLTAAYGTQRASQARSLMSADWG